MLHRKPMGKNQYSVYHWLMLRGGYDIWNAPRNASKLVTKKSLRRRIFVKKSNASALTGAPAIQVNYDFYEISLRCPSIASSPISTRAKTQAGFGHLRPLHDRDPQKRRDQQTVGREVPQIDVYCSTAAINHSKKRWKRCTRHDHRRSQKSNLRAAAVPVPNRMKWSLCEDNPKQNTYLQRRRSEPALQRPPVDGNGPTTDRSMIICRPRHLANRGFIYIRGEYRYVLDLVEAAIEEAYQVAISARHSMAALRFDLLITPAQARKRWGEESALMDRWKASALSAHQAALPAVVGSTAADHIYVETSRHSAIIRESRTHASRTPEKWRHAAFW